MASRLRRHRSSNKEVELNLAAMLDMAFQLLAFFILTFQPSPVEGYLQLLMPPPTPVTQVPTETITPSSDGSGISPDLQTLNLFLGSSPDGRLTYIRAGSKTILQGPLTAGSSEAVKEQLKALLGSGITSFEGVQLHVDSQLQYEDLMRVVDLCTQQTLPDGSALSRVSFVENTTGQPGAPDGN